MEKNNEIKKSELQLNIEKECPIFFSKYKNIVFDIIDMKSDFYVSDIGWFMLQEFNRELNGLDITSKEIIQEINYFKNIIKDVWDNKYNNLRIII